MDDVRTMTREYRQYPEYSEKNSSRRADDRFEDALRGNPLRSNGMDRTGDVSQTRVSVTRKTTRRGGQMTVGWNRTHSPRIQYSGRVVTAEQEVGQP